MGDYSSIKIAVKELPGEKLVYKIIPKRLMITCKEATLFITKKEEINLSVKDRIKLSIHLVICKFCNLFEQQSKFINLQVKHSYSEAILTENEKVAMEQSLRDEPNYR